MKHTVIIELDKDEVLRLVRDARSAELSEFDVGDGVAVEVWHDGNTRVNGHAGRQRAYTFNECPGERLCVTFSRDVDL